MNYMSCECFIVNGANLNEKTDSWSYACCLIELFGGAVPWSGLDEVEIGRYV